MLPSSGVQDGSWENWEEQDLVSYLRASKIDEVLIKRLLSDAWNCGQMLPELTTQDLKNAEFKPGHIALMKTFFRTHRIPNPDLNPKSSSAASDEVQQGPSPLALAMKKQAQALATPSGLPSVFKLSMAKTGEDVTNKIRSFVIGSSPLADQNVEKRILVLGSTGSGKTTWINGVANFLYGVQWEDDFRFTAVTEEDETGPNRVNRQAFSQTDFVTSYKFVWQPGFPYNFNVVLIDTPGFGDTRGFQRDEQITIQLKSLFETKGALGLDQLDAIAFVIQGSIARLTPTQKYIFHSILSIFGRDVVGNMLIVTTWGDSKDPVVRVAIDEEKIGYQKLLKFNNSALFEANSGGSQSMEGLFWKIGTCGYTQFFESLLGMQPRSLRLTREVLKERQSLQVVIQGIHKLIAQGTSELDLIEQEERLLKQHERDIQANRNYTVTVTVRTPQATKSPPRLFVTNCSVCNMTCHHGCAIIEDSQKHGCSAMDSNGHCKCCPGKCHWQMHHNQPFFWELKTIEKKETLNELLAKWQDATSKKTNVQSSLANMRRKYNMIEQQLRDNVEAARQHVIRLGEIAARPNPLSSVDYINMLIQVEQQTKASGWEVRIRHLEEVRAYAETRTKIQQSSRFDPDQWTNRKRQ
jgi:hypothetical protein